MARINGTYVSLHEACDDYPFYKGNLEFNGTLCLADYFEKVGSYDTSDTYQFRGITYTNKELSAPKIPETEALLAGIIPDKALLFTESNSAHHLTYFYVKEAARHLLDGDKLLVVNFDQHEDTGGNDSIFYCGSWGGNRICNAVGCDYLVVGPKYVDRTVFGNLKEYFEYKEQNAKKTKPAYAANLYTRDGGVIDCAATAMQDLYARYDKIYVTVDMDVLTCGSDVTRTNWGSGNMTLEQLGEHLAELPGNKLIAADITGFPPVNSEKYECGHDLLNSYINDIRDTSVALCNLMGIPPFID